MPALPGMAPSPRRTSANFGVTGGNPYGKQVMNVYDQKNQVVVGKSKKEAKTSKRETERRLKSERATSGMHRVSAARLSKEASVLFKEISPTRIIDGGNVKVMEKVIKVQRNHDSLHSPPQQDE